MSQQERREAIVAATVPLLLADGGELSTSRIAEAAGIAEGTVFRAFRDKRELLSTCARQALVADAEVARIGEIDHDAPMRDRLTDAVVVVGGYLDRVWQVARAMHAAGMTWDRKHGQSREDGDEPHRDGPMQIGRITRQIATLLGAGPDVLRTSPETAATLLLGLVFSNRRTDIQFSGTASPLSSAELVELFLNGAAGDGAAPPTGKSATTRNQERTGGKTSE